MLVRWLPTLQVWRTFQRPLLWENAALRVLLHTTRIGVTIAVTAPLPSWLVVNTTYILTRSLSLCASRMVSGNLADMNTLSPLPRTPADSIQGAPVPPVQNASIKSNAWLFCTTPYLSETIPSVRWLSSRIVALLPSTIRSLRMDALMNWLLLTNSTNSGVRATIGCFSTLKSALQPCSASIVVKGLS